MSPVVIPASFDPAQTLDCGQAFRWRESRGEDGLLWWEGAAGNRALRLRREGDVLILRCSREDFENHWRLYFDLESDYDAMRRELSALSPALSEAAALYPGIRILRQEPWEALCSFLISQNNNIPRIKGVVERLCALCGRRIPGAGLPAFPTAEAMAALSAEDFFALGAGYRAKYLADAARKVSSGEVDLEKIARSPVEIGRSELRKIAGVGPKVAECVLLYGFHRMECFPVDVWMKRAMETLFPGMAPEDFGENAGLAQQYIFHYSRMHPELFRAADAG